MNAAPTISTQSLSRRFGDLVAVDGVDLQVAPGQFFGFLGPNGAGKSTTIKMLTGLLAPTSGRIEILGIDLNANPVEVKRQIGVVPEGMALFGRLTGAEFLSFAGRMYGLDRETSARRAAELLEFMQLADQPKKLVTDYSHGMQKKLAMAAAVIHGPKVLFLDEPFEGVDAIAAGTLKAMLQRMIARGATIFLTSHVLEIVERLCSHVAIIDRGVLVAQGSLEELRAGVEAQAPGTLEAEPGRKLTLEEIFLHSLRSKRGAVELFSRIVIGAVITGGGLGGAILLGGLAWYFVSQGNPEALALVLWPVFLFWQMFPLMATALSESIDSTNLLRFPLSYRTYVMVRLVYGALDPATVLGTFWLVGITIGIGWARPGLMPWSFVVLVVFAAVKMMLTQMIFAWVERWLGQRRTREIFAVLFFLAMISLQLIGPMLSRYGDRSNAAFHWAGRFANPIQAVLPPGIAAGALASKAAAHIALAFGLLGALVLYAAVILRILSVRLHAQFRGENLSEVVGRGKDEVSRPGVRLAWKMPGLSQEAAAVV